MYSAANDTWPERDDEALIVVGGFGLLPKIREFPASGKPGAVGNVGGTRNLRDPGHDPVGTPLILRCPCWPVI
ncbi:MAG: hypothetical protein OXI66_15205 [Boseongicola sp.]|nr:hypothetical protein [Boseongicola sp.]